VGPAAGGALDKTMEWLRTVGGLWNGSADSTEDARADELDQWLCGNPSASCQSPGGNSFGTFESRQFRYRSSGLPHSWALDRRSPGVAFCYRFGLAYGNMRDAGRLC
jgi:hypothetical protein